MIGVLDTSAAVEVVLKRESSALFTDFLAEADLVIAPTLSVIEATNVFWKYQKFSETPYAEMLLTYFCHSAGRALGRSCRIQLFLSRVNPSHPGKRSLTGRMRGFGILGFHSLTHRLRRSPLSQLERVIFFDIRFCDFASRLRAE